MEKKNIPNKPTQQRSSVTNSTNKKPSAPNRKPVARTGAPPQRGNPARPPQKNVRPAGAPARTMPERAMANKAPAQKRKKFRGGNYALYYVLAFIVIIVVLIILANTVLFKCTTIEVSGNEKYTAEEIVERSGLQIGENLLHINVSSARDNIVNSLAYIDDAQVKKSFPTKINVTVTEAEKQYCIVENGVTAAISRKGKILEHGSAGDLPIVKGFESESTQIGTWLRSRTEGKTEIPGEIFDKADKTGLDGITEVDMTDRFSVKVTVEDRVILNLGPAEEIERKFRVAVEIIENQLGKDEYVTILLTNPEKVPVQNNSRPQQSTSTTTSLPPVSSSDTSQTEPDNNSDSDPEPDTGPDTNGPEYDPETAE